MAIVPIEGLHHVTSVASDPSRNYRFYTEVLGLRLVKKTVNFDDVTTYHLYYGNETGEPGTALTFFPFEDGRPGRVGAGQVQTTQFHVPEGSLDYWQARFDDHGVEYDAPEARFDESEARSASTDASGDQPRAERVLAFRDHDGLEYELVATDQETTIEPWGEVVPKEYAIRGFYGVALAVTEAPATTDLLETMGYERVASEGRRNRYEVDGEKAVVVDVVETDVQGRPGVGTVHHVAFRVADDEAELAWQDALRDDGFQVTDQKDRQYFRSIYFRERNGILFEFATNGPGFDRDEVVAELGSDLKLPPWLQEDRERIESRLPPLELDTEAAQ